MADFGDFVKKLLGGAASGAGKIAESVVAPQQPVQPQQPMQPQYTPINRNLLSNTYSGNNAPIQQTDTLNIPAPASAVFTPPEQNQQQSGSGNADKKNEDEKQDKNLFENPDNKNKSNGTFSVIMKSALEPDDMLAALLGVPGQLIMPEKAYASEGAESSDNENKVEDNAGKKPLKSSGLISEASDEFKKANKERVDKEQAAFWNSALNDFDYLHKGLDPNYEVPGINADIELLNDLGKLGYPVYGTTPELNGTGIPVDTAVIYQPGEQGAEEASSKSDKDKSQDADPTKDFLGPMPPDMNEIAEIYGMPLADYNALSQRDQFINALQQDDLNKYYLDTYGDAIMGDNGYEWFRDLGENGNMQDKHDLVRDLFGYNLDENGNSRYGVEGWQDLARNSGIDLSGDDEQDIQNILEYMWGAENIINPYLYLNVGGDSGDYASTVNLSNNDATGVTSSELANYLLNTYGDFQRIADTNGVDLGGLDSRDFANMMAFGNMMYNGLGSGFNDADLANAGNMLGLGGDLAKFKYSDEGEEGFDWQSSDDRIYDPSVIYQNLVQMYNAANAGAPVPINQIYDIYSGEGVDSAINAHLADDMMAYIQNKNAGKSISRS